MSAPHDTIQDMVNEIKSLSKQLEERDLIIRQKGYTNSTVEHSMVNINVNDIYNAFVERYGINQQILQSVEETTELNKEILKYVRFKNDGKDTTEVKNNLIEELGDVYNALGSLIYILNIDINDLDRSRLKKLEKYYINNVKGSQC